MLMCVLTTSCTKDNIDDLPYRIDMISENRIELGYGATEEILFQVHPADAVFNHDLSSPDCQVRLVVENHVGLAYQESEYYRLTDVSKVPDVEGVYVATIEDLKTEKEYRETALIYISNLKKGRKERHTVTHYAWGVLITQAP
jgi:hypothetical protein